MQLQSKRWKIAPPVSQQYLARFGDLDPLVVQLLRNRQIDRPDLADDFLAGLSAKGNPFGLKGMGEAVMRLRAAIRREEQIAVYGDFDTDGVTATALLVEVLSALGARVEPYIPHRVDEGYGLNLPALRDLYRRGVRLVVTVDCGIRSFDEVEQASRGLDLIITDHHAPARDKPLPPALAIINPKQPDCPYPFDELAGVGLAFKLAQGLLHAEQYNRKPVVLAEERFLDLVALGTVADLVPLFWENRSLVRRGLEQLNQGPRPGIEALMAEAGVRQGEVDATAIGFRLGPRLNAAGRIDTAMLAYRLLTSRDALETRDLARMLGELNRERQQLTEQTVLEAKAQALDDDADACLYMAASAGFKPGIVGLAASRLTEAYYRPAVVVEVGPEVSHGSCRSIPEFHITEALDACEDLLDHHGGHAAAAGFTVRTDKLDALRRRLKSIAAEELEGVELKPLLEIDAEVALEDVGWDTHQSLRRLEPCGMGNPQPVLLSRGVEVRDRRQIGSDGSHLKLVLGDGRGAAWDAIFFRQGALSQHIPARVDVAYRLGVNERNHEKRLQIEVQDLREPSP
ncbi:MAG: single-stranded-DNA-specific exonuclease RecJ [Anaerolineae bacterium]